MTQQGALLVDEPPIHKRLSSNLKASGYAVRSAADGAAASQRSEEDPFAPLPSARHIKNARYAHPGHARHAQLWS